MSVLDLKEVIRKTTLGRSTIYAYEKDGKFPKSVKLSKRHVVWVEREIDEWIASRIAASRKEGVAA
jgi:prophage regulatory protein